MKIDSGYQRTFDIKGWEITFSMLDVRRFIYSLSEFLLASWLFFDVALRFGTEVIPIWVQLTMAVWWLFKPYYLLNAIGGLFTFHEKLVNNQGERK